MRETAKVNNMKTRITKRVATNASGTAFDALYEVRVIREAAEFIQDNHSDRDCESAHAQVEVLQNVGEEKLDLALEAIDFVNDYFIQANPKAKKKLAIVKSEAA